MQNFQVTVELKGKELIMNFFKSRLIPFKQLVVKFVVNNCRQNGDMYECSERMAKQNAEKYAQDNFKLNRWKTTNINGVKKLVYISSIKAISIRPVGDF